MDSSPSYTLKQTLLGLILPVVVIGVPFIAGYLYQIQQNELPAEVRTVGQFKVAMPTPEKAERFQRDGFDYLEITAHRAGFPAVPSGNAKYIFDDKGQLAYWTIDDGDSSQYWREWGNRKENVRQISVDEAFR